MTRLFPIVSHVATKRWGYIPPILVQPPQFLFFHIIFAIRVDAGGLDRYRLFFIKCEQRAYESSSSILNY